VAWVDNRLIGQAEKLAPDAFEQQMHIATGEIGPADRLGEKRVVGEYGTVVPCVEADTAGGMAWGMEDFKAQLCGLYPIAVLHQNEIRYVDGEGQAEGSGEVRVGVCEHGGIKLVDIYGKIGVGSEQGAQGGDVVNVAVRENSGHGGQIVLPEKLQQGLVVEARIKNQAVGLGGASAKQVAIGLVQSYDEPVNFHLPKALKWVVAYQMEPAASMGSIVLDRGWGVC